MLHIFLQIFNRMGYKVFGETKHPRVETSSRGTTTAGDVTCHRVATHRTILWPCMASIMAMHASHRTAAAAFTWATQKLRIFSLFLSHQFLTVCIKY
jgi:hypothetical protein